ncbi:MAG: diacylglycerol kinase family protein [Slackia faecicanis]|nr:diacylglycerol kinase family protein [Slackia faecicanis]
MGKALLIVNPDSGRRDGAVFAQCVLPLLEEAFDQVECRMSRSAYDVESWACEACASVEALFVMGGDGTVGLGLRGLFEGRRRYGRMPTFNPLPAGTGNGFVRTLGLPSDPAQVVAALDFSKTKVLDATFVNGVSFVHTVTGGTLPEGIREVSSDVKTRFGLSAYAASELLRVGNDRRYRLRIVADGEEIIEDIGSFVAFSANALANEFTSCVPTRLDDGLLHLIALKRASFPALASLAPHALARTLEKSREVLYLHARSFEISCLDAELSCGVDGDEGPLLPVSLSIEPGALRVFAPKDFRP